MSEQTTAPAPVPTPTTSSGVAIHPMANLYPRCTTEERSGLKEDIKLHGVMYPAVFWTDAKGQRWLIDGRTRREVVDELRAEGVTQAANGNPIECSELDFEGAESAAAEYVESLNLIRRSLSSSQKAACAIKSGMYQRLLAHREAGGNGESDNGMSEEAAEVVAKRAGTNRQYIHDCAKIGRKFPDLLDAIASNLKTIADAKRIMVRREQGLPDDPPMPGEAPNGVPGPSTPPVPAEPPEVLDGNKNPVAPDLHDVFMVRTRVREVAKMLKKLKAEAEDVAESPGGRTMSKQAIKSDIQNAIRHLEDHQPHAPCPYCSATGHGDDPNVPCEQCKGKKYLDRSQWKSVPPEMKAVFESPEAAAANAAEATATAE